MVDHLKEVKTFFQTYEVDISDIDTIFRPILGKSNCADLKKWNTQRNVGIITSEAYLETVLNHAISRSGPKKLIAQLKDSLEEKGYFPCNTVPNLSTAQSLFQNLKKLQFNLPYIDKFAGRKDKIQILTERFNSNLHQIVLICGYGGIGKTDLAGYFLNTLQTTNAANWVFLRGESTPLLKDALLELLIFMGYKERYKKNIHVADLLLQVMKCIDAKYKGKSVLVFDGLENISTDLLSSMEDILTGDTMIIITSRDRKLIHNCYLMDIEELSEAESTELVEEHLPSERKTDVQILCKFVDNHPLALRAAIQYITFQRTHCAVGRGYEIASYISDCESNRTNLLCELPCGSYGKTILETLQRSIDLLRQRSHEDRFSLLATKILDIVAFFRDKNIDYHFLFQTFKDTGIDFQDVEFQTSVELLKSLSLLKSENRNIEVQPILQFVLQEKIASDPRVIEYPSKILKGTAINELSESSLRHVSCMWNHLPRSEEYRNVITASAFQISLQFDQLCLYQEGLEYAKRCYRTFLSPDFPGSNDRSTIMMSENVAKFYSRVGKDDEALERLESIYKQRQILLGETDKETIETFHHIAGVYYSMRRYDEAIATYKKVRELRKGVQESGRCKSVDENLETLKAFHKTEVNIANALIGKGEFTTACDVLSAAKDWFLANNCISEGLRTWHSIGYCNFKNGKYSKAKNIFEDLLEERKRHCPAEKNKIYLTQYMLGRTYMALELFDKSQQILQSTYEEQIKLGKSHPDAMATADKLQECIQLSRGAQSGKEDNNLPSCLNGDIADGDPCKANKETKQNVEEPTSKRQKTSDESVRSLAAPDSTVILPTGTAGSSASLPTPTPMSTTTNFTDSLMRKKVAKILVEDLQLLRTWEDFSDLLGVPPHETMSWKRQYDIATLTATSLLDNILIFWISRNGKKASVNALCDILVTGQYEMLAGRLKDEFNITQ